jgi:hypothetical protein
MRGTEKQLSWATEIQQRVISIVETTIAEAKADPRNDPENPIVQANIKSCEAIIDAVKSCESAGDMIDCFKSVRDFGDIISVYRVHVPKNAGQRKLLMK